MVGRLRVLVLAAVFLPLVPAQQRPPSTTAPAAFDADAVVQEINDFYTDYWKAWNQRDLEHVAASLDPEFVGFQYVAPQGVVQLDKEAALASIRQFFEAVRGQETIWSRNLLSVVPRSGDEAVAAVRNDFTLLEAGGEAELTLEVVRKGADGRWRLVRKWTEKRAY